MLLVVSVQPSQLGTGEEETPLRQTPLPQKGPTA
jgi:hypothetical protein